MEPREEDRLAERQKKWTETQGALKNHSDHWVKLIMPKGVLWGTALELFHCRVKQPLLK